jgi:hypothetical protein
VAGGLGDPAPGAPAQAYETRRALVISLVLIGVGVVGTFPIFFQLFER